MPYSAGVYSLPSNSFAVPVTGTTISSSAATSTFADFVTAFSTAILKDGTQTITANIPMSSFKLTGLAAGSANGDSVRWQQASAGVLTTTGDILYASAANTPARLAVGTARQQLAVNSGATAPEWVASAQSLMTTTGDTLYASSANTPARLAIGTARQQLATNSGATAPEWVASLQSLMTGTGDIVQSSSANTPARLAIGTARQVPTVNSGATALAYANPITLGTEQSTASGTAWDFTGIPAGVRRITVMFVGVSTNGTSNLLIQIGDAGGIETTGYASTAGVGTTFVGSTAGFVVTASNDGAYARNGMVILSLQDASDFTWTEFGNLQRVDAPDNSAGAKALSAELTQLRITTVNGTDAGDAGVLNISYE